MASLLSKLPFDKLESVRCDLNSEYPKGENLSMEKFLEILIKTCRQSDSEVTRNLENIRFDGKIHKSMKDLFFCKISQF